jgi:hypothetical protein
MSAAETDSVALAWGALLAEFDQAHPHPADVVRSHIAAIEVAITNEAVRRIRNLEHARLWSLHPYKSDDHSGWLVDRDDVHEIMDDGLDG